MWNANNVQIPHVDCTEAQVAKCANDNNVVVAHLAQRKFTLKLGCCRISTEVRQHSRQKEHLTRVAKQILNFRIRILKKVARRVAVVWVNDTHSRGAIEPEKSGKTSPVHAGTLLIGNRATKSKRERDRERESRREDRLERHCWSPAGKLRAAKQHKLQRVATRCTQAQAAGLQGPRATCSIKSCRRRAAHTARP